MQKHIFIDYETYSSVDLAKHGLRRYIESEDFEVLLLAVGEEIEGRLDKVRVYEADKGKLPREVLDMLASEDYVKHAWNAQFERVVTEALLGRKLHPRTWHCTMAEALYCGLPGSLKECGAALNIAEKKKDEGAALISRFSKPRKPTKKDQRTRLTKHDLDQKEAWSSFIEYCRQDVVAEFAIHGVLPIKELPTQEMNVYVLDQLSNEKGVAVDVEFAKTADEMYKRLKVEKKQEIENKYGIANSNSTKQVIEAIEAATGEQLSSIRKDVVAEKRAIGAISDFTDALLKERASVSKSSCAKYSAAIRATSSDGRLRGELQYYGANRTGRFSGRQVQLQNQPKQSLEGLELAREQVLAEDAAAIELCWGDVAKVLSELIRSMFVAEEGKLLIAIDFSAIEARVLSWLAEEKWRLDVFRTHGKIYEASAAKMFGIDIALVTKGSPWRDKGKVAELALGFGGAVSALKRFGATAMGLHEDELQQIVYDWRNASPSIVKFWRNCERAAVEAMQRPGEAIFWRRDLVFRREKHKGREWLTIQLPSGRKLMYYNPTLVDGKFGGFAVSYEGMADDVDGKKTKVWGRLDTYGGKITANITQATARDCLTALEQRIYNELGIVYIFQVHDEVVLEEDEDKAEEIYEKIEEMAATSPSWAAGLPIKGEGFVSKVYKK